MLEMLEKGEPETTHREVSTNTEVQQLQDTQPVSTQGQDDGSEKQEGQMQLPGLLPLPPLEREPVLRPEPQLGKKHGGDSKQVQVDWNTGVGNVLTVYSHADRWDREFGMKAYENYKDKIVAIAAEHGSWSDSTAIGVFAALSPNMDERTNFLALHRVLAFHDVVPAYPQSVEKARRIIQGESPMAVLGRKTRAFYQNILQPGDIANPVVVDAHMYSVWKLKRHTVTQVDIDAKLYACISRDFGKAAAMIGIRPNQLQATCWTVWKRRNNIVFKEHQPKLEMGG